MMLRSSADEHSRPTSGPSVGIGIGRSVTPGRRLVRLAGRTGTESVFAQHSMFARHDAIGSVVSVPVGSSCRLSAATGAGVMTGVAVAPSAKARSASAWNMSYVLCGGRVGDGCSGRWGLEACGRPPFVRKVYMLSSERSGGKRMASPLGPMEGAASADSVRYVRMVGFSAPAKRLYDMRQT